MNIGTRIMELRCKSDLTQAELANLSGASQRAISAYEQGERLPNVKTIGKLAKAFGLTFNEFIDGVKFGEE